MTLLQRDARSIARPAPVRGLNVLDPIAEMEDGFATVLDNMLPKPRYVEMRRGYREHNDVGADEVESLFAYRGASSEKLIAFAGTTAWDVTATAAEAVPGSLATSLTEDDIGHWQGVNFNGRGILVNGADEPRSFNGTAMSDAGFTGTGLTPSSLFAVVPFKNRLFFLDAGSANIWYGGIDAITGPLEKFPLSTVHPEGGRPLALGTLTMDGGSGVDDRLVVFMSSGDALVYAGDDISNAGRWQLEGIFNVGRVIGRRPLMKLGADLIAITSDGYVPLSQFMRYGRSRTDMAISNLISGAVNTAVERYADEDGWQALLYPRGTYALFNVPADPPIQHVMNTQTGAWCRFTGQPARCWALHKDRLFFGGPAGKVYEADTARSDAGNAISATAQGAYSYFRYPGNKQITYYRPILEVSTQLPFKAGFGVDFGRVTELEEIVAPAGETAKWNTAKWGTFKWGGAPLVYAEWQSAGALGQTLAERIEVESDQHIFRWFSTEMVFRRAGAL